MQTSSAALNAISPLDGRYAAKLRQLAPLLSEAGLIRARIRVEAAWLLCLLGEPAIRRRLVQSAGDLDDTAMITTPWYGLLTRLARPMESRSRQAASGEGISADVIDDPDSMKVMAQRVKDLEAVTNHDVKAVELCLQEALNKAGAPAAVVALTHFGCTSEDINNLSWALILEEFRREHLIPQLVGLIDRLAAMVDDNANAAMLARTHGQPATPTTFGKEVAVFAARLAGILDDLMDVRIMAKFNGATGGLSAHVFAMPEVDWLKLTFDFIGSFEGLHPNPLTTQIESHDWIARLSASCSHLSSVATGLSRDFWQYISDGWCVLKRVESETGSSTMPHKINPIDFENAEGNFGVAQSLFELFARKLTISRLQRDLTDSTTMRNLGVAFGHLQLGLQSIEAGLNRLQVNRAALTQSLESHWEVLGEAVQSLLRMRGVEGAYGRMKSATRGLRMSRTDYLELVDSLVKMPDVASCLTVDDINNLKSLTPSTYTGESAKLASIFSATWTRRRQDGNQAIG